MGEDNTSSNDIPQSLLIEVATTSERLNNLMDMFKESQKSDKEFKAALVESHKELTVALTSSTVNHQHLEREVEEHKEYFRDFIKDKFDPLEAKVETHGNVLSGNRIRWVITGTVATALFTGVITVMGIALNLIVKNVIEQLREVQVQTVQQQVIKEVEKHATTSNDTDESVP